MALDPKIYVFEDVSKHNQIKDCWLIIHGKGCSTFSKFVPKGFKGYSLGRFEANRVYDVTPFMEDHPGGAEVLLAATGKDATNDFEDVGHSKSAKEMMDTYYIGEIDVSTIQAKRNYLPPGTAAHNPDKSGKMVIKILQFLVPLMILGLALTVRHYTKVD